MTLGVLECPAMAPGGGGGAPLGGGEIVGMFLTEAWGSLLTTANMGSPLARARAAVSGSLFSDGSGAGVNDGVGGGVTGIRGISPSLLPEELDENESGLNSGKGGKSWRMDPAGLQSAFDAVDKVVTVPVAASVDICSLSFPCSGAVLENDCGFTVSIAARPLGIIGLSMASAASVSACAFVTALWLFLIASGVALAAPFLLFVSD